MTNEEIVTRIKDGDSDPDLMLILYEQNYGLINRTLKPFRGCSEEPESLQDLRQEAFLALYDAVTFWKPEAETAFNTIMVLIIKQKLSEYARRQTAVSFRDLAYQETRRFVSIRDKLTAQLGREPSERELMHSCGYLKADQVRDQKARAILLSSASLDAPVNIDSESEVTLADITADDGKPSLEDVVIDQLAAEGLKRELWSAVAELPGQAPEIIHRRYQEGQTAHQIGEACGLSDQAVTDQAKRGLEKIRRGKHGSRLHEYGQDMGILGGFARTGFGYWRNSGCSVEEAYILKREERGKLSVIN